MLQFNEIVDAVHGLSNEEKVKLRLVIDAEIAASTKAASDGIKHGSKLIGFCADEPELMDQVMEAVYERRSRPLRINE